MIGKAKVQNFRNCKWKWHLTRLTHIPTFHISVAWTKIAEGKTCDVVSVNKGKLSSVSLCSEECRFQATMFSYSVPDSPECDDSGCTCKCMSGASKEATCARVDSVHDHLYAFRGRNVYHVKYCLNIIPSYFPATRINVYLKVSSVGWVLASISQTFAFSSSVNERQTCYFINNSVQSSYTPPIILKTEIIWLTWKLNPWTKYDIVNNISITQKIRSILILHLLLLHSL